MKSINGESTMKGTGKVSTKVLVTTTTLCILLNPITAFQTAPFTPLRPLFTQPLHTLTTLSGTNRKARRELSRSGKNKSQPQTFLDNDSEAKTKKSPKAKEEPDEPGVLSGSSIADADFETDRPEVSTVIIDESTGIERIAQGKAVMDVVTRKAVKLSDLGPEYILAQMFPGVPPELSDKYRFKNFADMDVMDMIAAFEAAATLPLVNTETGEEVVDLPPPPKVTNTAIDFCIANRDHLGFRMSKTLGRLKLRAQSEDDTDKASKYRALWMHFITLEDHISAPFRQCMLDAEAKIGPNFGNLDLKSYIGQEVYQRTASYLVLKGMVAHWEKKLRDAEYVESTPDSQDTFFNKLCTGDPKRYLPDPPIIFRLEEVKRVVGMAQKQVSVFVEDETMFNDLPVEVRFVEVALSISGGTQLRKFLVDFCAEEGVAPENLREGLRRLDAQLRMMQIDPYGDIKNTVGRLCEALSVGTDDEKDPYKPYLYNLDKKGPGYFQTYTFNHHKNSMVRFLDNAKTIQKGTAGPTDSVIKQLGSEFQTIFGIQTAKENLKEEKIKFDDFDEFYRPPPKRAIGRPHMMGWLDSLDEEVHAHEGIEETAKFESDDWKEVS